MGASFRSHGSGGYNCFYAMFTSGVCIMGYAFCCIDSGGDGDGGPQCYGSQTYGSQKLVMPVSVQAKDAMRL